MHDPCSLAHQPRLNFWQASKNYNQQRTISSLWKMIENSIDKSKWQYLHEVTFFDWWILHLQSSIAISKVSKKDHKTLKLLSSLTTKSCSYFAITNMEATRRRILSSTFQIHIVCPLRPPLLKSTPRDLYRTIHTTSPLHASKPNRTLPKKPPRPVESIFRYL